MDKQPRNIMVQQLLYSIALFLIQEKHIRTDVNLGVATKSNYLRAGLGSSPKRSSTSECTSGQWDIFVASNDFEENAKNKVNLF